MSTYLKIKLTIKTGSVCPKVYDGIEIKLILSVPIIYCF